MYVCMYEMMMRTIDLDGSTRVSIDEHYFVSADMYVCMYVCTYLYMYVKTMMRAIHLDRELQGVHR